MTSSFAGLALRSPAMLPQASPITVVSFDYAPIALALVLVVATVWWFTTARRRFEGPVGYGRPGEAAVMSLVLGCRGFGVGRPGRGLSGPGRGHPDPRAGRPCPPEPRHPRSCQWSEPILVGASTAEVLAEVRLRRP